MDMDQFESSYPNLALGPISATIFISCVSLLSFLCGSRLKHWKQLTYARITVILILLDTLIFAILIAILALGIGTDDVIVCEITMWLCVTLYAASKFFTTLFLIERAHIVNGGGSRVTSTLYRINMILPFAWIVIFIAMCITHSSSLTTESNLAQPTCNFNLPQASSIAALLLDIGSNVWLGSLFFQKLYENRFSSQRLKRLAIRSIIAAVVSTASSSANLALITVLVHRRGGEKSYICLIACVLDATICSLAIYIVTNGDHIPDPIIPTPSLAVKLSFNQSLQMRSEKFSAKGSPIEPNDSVEDLAAPFSSLKINDPSQWRGDYGASVGTATFG